MPTPASVRKAEREIAEFRKFQELSRSFVDLNEKICRLRPVPEQPFSEQEKKADAIQQEVTREVEQLLRTIFTGMRKTGQLDLEAVEMPIRSAMRQAGASTLTELLRFPAPNQRALPCPCGQQALCRELRCKAVLTAVGKVEVLRPYYLCPHGHERQISG